MLNFIGSSGFHIIGLTFYIICWHPGNDTIEIEKTGLLDRKYLMKQPLSTISGTANPLSNIFNIGVKCDNVIKSAR